MALTVPGPLSQNAWPRSDPPSRAAVRRTSPARRVIGALVSLSAALALLVAAPGPAAAAPDIDTVRKQVDKLSDEAAEATEAYNGARVKLDSATVAVRAADTRVVEQQKRVEVARRMLGRIARETYKSGDLNGLLLLLDDDPQAMMAARGLRSSLGDRQARGVQALVAEQKRLDTDLGELAEQKAELTATRDKLAANKKAIEAKLAARTAILNRLNAAQRAALQRASAASSAADLSEVGVSVPAGGRLTCAGVGIQAPNARAAQAIAFACAQLGKPYRWGGSGPGSYDCSGLTQAAWASAGVSLPHNAAMQSGYGTRVSSSQLQPGDIVFFYSPISHNGIYIGKGLMIHAPRTGDVIKIASARLNGSLTAAVRPG